MAQKFYNESDIQAIASAIRAKNGLSNTYKVSQMASAIQNIPSGGGGNTDIEDGLITGTLSIYENSRVTTIRSYAFNSCITLTSVNFPQATTIGSYAFNSCITLTSVNFPQATTIGNNAFNSCNNLSSVNFPQATTIGSNVFGYCSKLTFVNFPQATTIRSSAFYCCTDLISVNFPQATTIGSSAFGYCITLTSVNFLQATTIGNNAFERCSGLTSISFPQATTIGIYTFRYCSKLPFVNFPQATTIGFYAFYSCLALSEVVLGGEESQSGQLFSSCFTMCFNLISLTLQGSHIYSLMNSNAFSSTPIGGYSTSAGQYGSIFVPASLYSQYISATNWAYFSSRIISQSTAGGGSN